MKKLTRPIIRPIQEFMQTESASGVVLIVATILALIAANTALHDVYAQFIETHFTIGYGSFALSKTLLHWINDGLMAIFFLLIGLEIKRELLFGELSTTRKAMLPVVAAFGGALIPGLIFYFMNAGTEYAGGWAIAIATDIAFAIGVLALLGSRIPLWAKVLLTATAVVDDLIAVVVIAVFYTEHIKLAALGLAAVVLVVLYLLNRAGVKKLAPYILLGIIMWVAVLKSGVHATIAGVMLGLVIPAYRANSRADMAQEASESSDQLMEAVENDDYEGQEVAIERLEEVAVSFESPLHRLEHKLHPWVSFGIMPLFAFANAGVILRGEALGAAFETTLTWGILLGLFVGKQIGIFAATGIMTATGLSDLPRKPSTWWVLYGLGLLSGIGFTMSLFITGLSFSDPMSTEYAKIGILAGSLLSGVLGYALLYWRGSDAKA